ncbi:hypothetical protein [Nonomuraea indica]|uniref:hypothetical protein n=1 Tax=Nonomuraea indica TaxID=1581193 RepID=UPI0011844D0D|nr:hypothetical protein [Nonomuraea indica]
MTDAYAGRKGGARSDLWGPALANLGLGVPAMVPFYLAWWLLTEYMPMDCALARPTNCNYDTLENEFFFTVALMVTGPLTLTQVIVIDVALPLWHRRRLAAWLGAAALIPVPFVVCLALASLV